MLHTVPERERHRFDPIFARLEAESLERFGLAKVRLTPVGYEERPFSWLCRAAISSEATATPALHVFIKIFKPKDPAAGVDLRARVVQDFATTCEIHAFMAPWEDLGAVRPIACYEDELTIVTEQADGATLLDALQAHATWFPSRRRVEALASDLASVGRWLKHFQGFHPRDGHLSAAGLREYVDTRLRRLVEHGVMSSGDRARILEHLQRIGHLVPEADLADVAVHADLAPANILVSMHRVVMLDFAMAGRGTPLHDISRLHMQLDLLRAKPQFRRAVIAPLQAALLHGYDPALTAQRPLFRLLSMLHHVNHLGTLALRRESFLARVVSARAIAMHRRWIAAELESGAP